MIDRSALSSWIASLRVTPVAAVFVSIIAWFGIVGPGQPTLLGLSGAGALLFTGGMWALNQQRRVRLGGHAMTAIGAILIIGSGAVMGGGLVSGATLIAFAAFAPALVWMGLFGPDLDVLIESIRGFGLTTLVLAVVSILVAAVMMGGDLIGVFAFIGLALTDSTALAFGIVWIAIGIVAIVLTLVPDGETDRRRSEATGRAIGLVAGFLGVAIVAIGDPTVGDALGTIPAIGTALTSLLTSRIVVGLAIGAAILVGGAVGVLRLRAWWSGVTATSLVDAGLTGASLVLIVPLAIGLPLVGVYTRPVVLTLPNEPVTVPPSVVLLGGTAAATFLVGLIVAGVFLACTVASDTPDRTLLRTGTIFLIGVVLFQGFDGAPTIWTVIAVTGAILSLTIGLEAISVTRELGRGVSTRRVESYYTAGAIGIGILGVVLTVFGSAIPVPVPSLESTTITIAAVALGIAIMAAIPTLRS